MPRFFFDISGGVTAADDTGSEFPDAHAARDEAIRTLPDMARDSIARGLSREVLILMRNEEGRALFTASLTLTAEWLVETL